MYLFYCGLCANLIIILSSYQAILSPQASSYTRIHHHRGVCCKHRTQELGYVLTLLAYLEESGTGISHEVGLAALGIAINDSAAPTYINLIFALSLMGDMPTNKARTSDNAQKQSASNAIPILFINSKYT